MDWTPLMEACSRCDYQYVCDSLPYLSVAEVCSRSPDALQAAGPFGRSPACDGVGSTRIPHPWDPLAGMWFFATLRLACGFLSAPLRVCLVGLGLLPPHPASRF